MEWRSRSQSEWLNLYSLYKLNQMDELSALAGKYISLVFCFLCTAHFTPLSGQRYDASELSLRISLNLPVVCLPLATTSWCFSLAMDPFMNVPSNCANGCIKIMPARASLETGTFNACRRNGQRNGRAWWRCSFRKKEGKMTDTETNCEKATGQQRTV